LAPKALVKFQLGHLERGRQTGEVVKIGDFNQFLAIS